MAAYNKYQYYSEALAKGLVDWDGHTFKLTLSNTAPDAAADQDLADAAEISAGNGFTAGGGATTITVSRSGGTTKAVGTDVVWTATGAMAAFRYVILYDATADVLVAYWDIGSAISMVLDDVFTGDVNPTNGFWTLG